jgi:hypothetical protein
MSTTTDRPRFATRAARFTGGAVLVMAIWFAGLATAAVMVEPTRSVVVFGPQQTTFRAVTSGSTRLVDAGTGFVVVNGDSKGFVRQLYAAGAWLVLPAISGGCRSRTAVASRKI